MKSLDKKKTKELEWAIKFDKFRNFDGIEYGSDFHNRIKDFIKQTLTRQRTELEQQKVMKENINKELDWEKTFYNNFCSRERNPYSNATFYIVDRNERNPEKYLRFISSLLDKQKKQILNLECLKEEEFDESDDVIDEEVREKRNQLRKEIIDEIKKL